MAFDWPLKAATGLTFNSYYGISNYVDQVTSSGIGDYNCGTRSYNGHRGTDIFTWPFPWYLVTNDYVEVIAAEAGTIVLKDDGNDDDHCACSGAWNAIYVEHSDGSVAWYGHMKENSLTTKTVGQTVVAGEYLGIVASSGCSTGPHLHFEVYKDMPYSTANLIDPYTGSCNLLNSTTWWDAQKPYREPTVNALLTHSAAPVQGCPTANEVPNFSNSFSISTTGYFAAYYHDQTSGHVSTYTIRRPNGTIASTWTHTSPDTYDGSWWYWTWTIPSAGPNGTWTWEVSYQSTTVTHNFTVTGAAPVEMTRFDAQKTTQNEVQLTWETASEHDNDYFTVERSGNGIDFTPIGKVKGNGSTDEARQFGFLDKKPVAGVNYYRLQQVDLDGAAMYSDVANVEIVTTSFYIVPNPTTDRIRIQGVTERTTQVRVFDALGNLVRLATGTAASAPIDLSGCATGMYFVEIAQEGGIERLKVLKR